MPKMTLGFLGLDVRLRGCVKEGKSSLRNMAGGDCSPRSESAPCEESTNRRFETGHGGKKWKDAVSQRQGQPNSAPLLSRGKSADILQLRARTSKNIWARSWAV